MAVERVAKVLIAVHRTRREQLTRRMQREGVLHVVHTEEHDVPDAGDTQRDLVRIGEAIDQLTPLRRGKRALFPTVQPVTREEFEQAARAEEAAGILDRLAELNQRRTETNNRMKALEAERRRLLPWRKLAHAAEELYRRARVTVVPGVFADEAEFIRVRGALDRLNASAELVEPGEAGASAVVVYESGCAAEVSTLLSTARFEPADLRAVRGRPADLLARVAEEERSLAAELEEIGARTAALAGELESLKLASDALATEHARRTTAAAFEETEATTIVTGWVRERHLDRLRLLVEAEEAATLVRVAPEPGEGPPVALFNRRLFRPFELVLELFSLPAPRELDPTVLLAPFFALFFAFCLTDAGYGIVLGLVAWLLLRRLGTGNKLLGVLVVGGIVTIFAGAIVGSWFGDLPDRLGFAPLLAMKNRLMLFDPVVNPMPFFILSISFGYVHMMYGIVIEIADCLRLRQFGDGLLGQLPWFVGLNGLVALVLAGSRMGEPARALVLALVLASVAAVLVFTRRSRETMAAQVLWFGLVWFVLVFAVARFGALPAVFLGVRWLARAVLLAMLARSGYALARARKGEVKGPAPYVLGGAAAAALALNVVGRMPALAAGLLVLAFHLASPFGRNMAKKLVLGGYALYSSTSLVGVVLSYVRIMALGMVTAGIAMAINTIAWMVLPIPVLGVLLAVIVLVFGHSYNIAVNVLGAFVHTLRLNYVEFFPRFYVGGGEPFVPFREVHRYVEVK